MIRRLLNALRRPDRGLDLGTVPAPPPPVPPSGAQVIRTRGLPDGYVPPSTSLRPGEIPVTWPAPDFGNLNVPQSVIVQPELAPIGILDGPLAPGATITIRTSEQARTAIRDAIIRTRGGSPEFADALAAVAVQALTGSPDA